MTVLELAVLAAATAVGQLAGSAWTGRRLDRLEETIGNGKPGAFVRRDVYELERKQLLTAIAAKASVTD